MITELTEKQKQLCEDFLLSVATLISKNPGCTVLEYHTNKYSQYKEYESSYSDILSSLFKMTITFRVVKKKWYNFFRHDVLVIKNK